ncbi:MAG: nuclear transport factor 2 family protein [Fimbriimonas sp.]
MKSLTVLLSLVAIVGISHADLRSELEASNRKIDRAMKAKDLKGVEAMMKAGVAPDFKYVEGSQTQDFKTFIGNLNGSLAMMKKIDKVSSRILSVKQTGDKATVKMEHTISGTMETPDKKVHTTSWTGGFTEELRKVGGKWKVAKMVPTSQKYLMDGKPVKM